MLDIFSLDRKVKQALMIAADVMAVACSFYLASALRLRDFVEPRASGPGWHAMLAVVAALTVALFYRAGVYHSVLHHISAHTLNRVLAILLGTSLAMYVMRWIMMPGLPRSVPLLYMAFMAIGYATIRLLVVNLYYYRSHAKHSPHIIIYGAGQCGTELAAVLAMGNRFYPAAYVDDDASKHGEVHKGVRVYAPEDIPMLRAKYGIEKIAIAMPSLSREERRAVVDRIKVYGIPMLAVPSMVDSIESTKVDAADLEEIRVEDILGRDPIKPMEDLLFKTTRGRAVLVTGAGGSIGSELCRQIASHNPKLLVLYELSEASLYLIDYELHQKFPDVRIIPCLGDVKNEDDLKDKLTTFGIQTVYHAAAYKHVPMVELNVIAGIRNNIFGTFHAAKACVECGVERFVLISTDKAVRPTNVMGCTKRCCELILQAYAAVQDKTCFCMVRFGNVLGSSGSVFPLFRKQIAAGGPVTVTHAEVTRYFMTIPEAVSLVLQASGMAKGGEVFVLDMGKPVKIIDMAREMIELAGKTARMPGSEIGDIEIKVVGLRPGEKLYEELLVSDNPLPTQHPRIMHQKETSLPMDELMDFLSTLDAECEARNVLAITEALKRPATAYQPKAGPSDVVWTEKKASA
ncbi:MAG: polysaccharide biosynthesis protein [Mailhella sp.]|nr:polysaccharide biosynthesis protein [Mailhella sp.]